MRFMFRWLRSVPAALRRNGTRVDSRRRRAVFGITAVMAAGVLVLFVASALGTPPTPSGPNPIGDSSAFEAADGNMTNDATGNLDWNCLTTPPDLAGSATCGADNGSYAHVQDLAAGTSADIGWTSGQKFDQACPALTNKNNSNKTTIDDIASYNDTNLVSSTGKFDTFLYGGVIRQVTTGTVSEDLELQQGTSGTCSGEPPGTTVYQRTAGDKLLAIDFSNGGTSASFNVLTWITSGTCYSAASPPCWGNKQTLDPKTTEAQANQTPISGAQDGIQSGDAKSTADPSGGAPSQLAVNAFAEFGIDLTASGVVAANVCTSFAQSLWESRSSTSFTANPNVIQIEPHSFSTCQPATINVVKVDSSTGNAISGAVFNLYAGSSATGSSLSTCTTGIDGKCTLGQVTGSATSTYTVKETTAPNGYGPGADQTCSISFSQTPQTCTLTFKDTPAPGTINIQKVDDASPANPVKGAVFTLYTDPNPGATGDSETTIDGDDTPVMSGGNPVTCTTDSSGACSFQSVNQGDYWVGETLTPSGYQTAPPQEATIGLGSAPGTGPTVNLKFVDPFAPATINVTKTDPNGVGLPGAVFQLYQGTTLLASCTTGDGFNNTTLGGCSFGQFTGTGTVTYTVHEQTPPKGYSGSGDQTLTVTYGNTPQTQSVTFKDTPVPGTISITKTDDASPGNPLSGATFALYVDSELSIGADSTTQHDGDDVAVPGATCTTGSDGKCSITSVPPGSYTVFETTTPSGYQTAPAQDVTVALGTTPGGGDAESLSFKDPRLHKVIVLVCSEGTNTLDSSSVSFDGGSSSLSSLDETASLPTGVTQAAVCGLGGATASDLADGAQSNPQIIIH
jgi:hypothetical protein